MAFLQPSWPAVAKPHAMTVLLLFSLSATQGAALHWRKPPNKGMHYNVISFGPAKSLLWIAEQPE